MAFDEISNSDNTIEKWANKINTALIEEGLPTIDLEIDNNIESILEKCNALIVNHGGSSVHVNMGNMGAIRDNINWGILQVDEDTGQVSVFILPDVAVLEPNTEYPSGFSTFSPSVSGNVSDSENVPAIIEWSKISNSGEVITLSIENFDNYTSFYASDGSNVYPCDILSNVNRQVVVTLSPSLSSNTSYMLWAVNEYGASEPVLVNTAIADWVGFDTVETGDSFFVYGKNLIIDGGSCWIYNSTENDWLECEIGSNPYKAEFKVPATWATGSHTLYLHNTFGGKYGWSDPVSVSVESEASWSGVVYDVTSYGANGADENDDYNAFYNTFSAAPNGATVYIPNGVYYLSNAVGPWKRNRVLGESESGVIIKNTYDGNIFSIGTEGCIFENLTLENQSARQAFGCYSSSERRGLSFINVTFSNLPYSTYGEGQLIQTQGYGNILFKDCTFLPSGPIYLKTYPDTFNVRFENCSFEGVWDCNMIVKSDINYLDFTGCTFQNYNAVDTTTGEGWAKGRCVVQDAGEYFYFGDNNISEMAPREPTPFYTDGVITSVGSLGEEEFVWSLGDCKPITINFQDIPDEYHGRGDGTFNYDGVKVYLRYNSDGDKLESYMKELNATSNYITVYIKSSSYTAAEQLSDIVTTEADFIDIVDQNSGEMLLCEGFQTIQAGDVISGTSNSIFVAPSEVTASGVSSSNLVFITGGKGLGQAIKVESVDSETGEIVLEDDWRVIPDSSSSYMFTIGTLSYVVYNNTFSGSTSGLGSDHKATTALQISASNGLVFANNTLINMRNVLRLYSHNGESNAVSSISAPAPNYFSYINNNNITSTARGINISLYDNGDPLAPGDSFSFGHVISNNVMSDITYEHSFGIYDDHDTASVGVNVFSSNNVSNYSSSDGKYAVPFGFSDNIGTQVLIGNSLSGNSSIDGLDSPNVSIINSEFVDFNNIYTVSFDRINIPRTLFYASSDVQTCIVQNQGTNILNWSSSLGHSGVVDPGDEDSFQFTISNPDTFNISGGGDVISISII